MPAAKETLSDDSLVLLFTYAPAGFGHLRVTDALYHGLPKAANPLLLETHDRTLTFLHRISSIHPFFRQIMEMIQKGTLESIVTIVYRYLLRSQKALITQQLFTILEQRISLPRKVLIISTHFGLAHQIAAIKPIIEHEKKVKVYLVVQVTDDSPQKIWYVPGADLTLVPSEHTKNQLVHYGQSENLDPVRFEELPYPISPTITKQLTGKQFTHRLQQTHAENDTPIHVAIPISGAAVGLEYYINLIDELYLKSQRFKFFVVTKSSLHTQKFINEMLKRPYVQLLASSVDKGVVEQYEQLYMNQLISLEITKPSEQSFKAIVDPERIGGSILLFTRPIGRQEYDNLKFLTRHTLIPNSSMQTVLWNHAKKNTEVTNDDKDIWHVARNWRGMKIQEDPVQAANYIWWCLENGIFTSMTHKKISTLREGKEHLEIHGAESTELFWNRVAELIED